MILKINNIGPFFGEHEIELEGITILAGLNGSGKSTFGKVLYCIFSTFNDIENKVYEDRIRRVQRQIFNNAIEGRADVKRVRSLIEYISGHVFRDLSSIIDEKEIYNLIDKTIADNTELNQTLKDKTREAFEIDESVIRERILLNSIESEFGNQICNVHAKDNPSSAELTIKESRISVSFNEESASIKEFLSSYSPSDSIKFFEIKEIKKFIKSFN